MELGQVPEGIKEEYWRLLGDEERNVRKVWSNLKDKHVRYI